jgi:hypothetical protein
MDAAAIGEFFSESSARTGRRFLKNEWNGPVYIVRGHRCILRSDFFQWLEGRKLEPMKQQPTELKSTLKAISDRVLADRKREAPHEL